MIKTVYFDDDDFFGCQTDKKFEELLNEGYIPNGVSNPSGAINRYHFFRKT